MAGKEGNRLHIVRESADVIYHMLVLLTFTAWASKDVSQEMRRREGISGIDEEELARRVSSNERTHLLPHRRRQIPAGKVFEDGTSSPSRTSTRRARCMSW